MAIRSSTIAKAAKNTFKLAGIRLPSIPITANAKAISVAMGIPQPPAVACPELKLKKMSAGTMAPPIAQRIGRDACLGEESSPSTISRLISSPTSRKKIAINPSLIQSSVLYFKCTVSESKPKGVSKNDCSPGPAAVLATMRDKMTQINNKMPPALLDLKKFLNTVRLINWLIVLRVLFGP